MTDGIAVVPEEDLVKRERFDEDDDDEEEEEDGEYDIF